MIDSISLALKKECCLGIDLIRDIPQFLSRVIFEGSGSYGKVVTGYLDNLKIDISENNVRISRGSLSKYFLRDNFRMMTMSDTKKAIEKIGESLHLPFGLASVSRIDLAQNLKMNYNEKIYYHYLGQSNHYKRLEQNNGLYYNTQIRQLLFYGKIQEQKAGRQPIPEQYENENLLRYELRFKNHLLQQLNLPQFSAELLYDESFFHSLINRWEHEYFAIEKIKSKLIKMNPTGSKKELIENLAFLSISEIGQSNVLNKVKEWQSKEFITKKQAFDLRKTIREISRIKVSAEENDLISELDIKIKEAANEVRSIC